MVVSLLSLVILLLSSGMRKVKERTDDLTYNTPLPHSHSLHSCKAHSYWTRNFRFRRADPEGEARPSKQVRANDLEGRNERTIQRSFRVVAIARELGKVG